MNAALKKILASPVLVALVYLALVVVATSQSYFLKPSGDGAAYTYYNNYMIFKQSFWHLVHQQDLYVLYEKEYFDLYKYSPTFAVFFGLFSWLPDIVGLLLWNILNSALLVYAVYALPRLELKYKTLILLCCCVEMMTSVQDSQSNALMAGLLVLAFGFFERNKIWRATLCIVLTVFIKIFGIIFLLLLLFYRQKPKIILSATVWAMLLAVLPLLFTGITHLWQLYLSWLNLLGNDHSASAGISFFSWINTWFHIYPGKTAVLGLGTLPLLVSAARVWQHNHFSTRMALFSGMLIWVVIFNHKAESPSYIIAATGVCLWYFNSRITALNTVLLVIFLLFTSLSPTDIFPAELRNNYLVPYAVKAVPCILVWFRITWELLTYHPSRHPYRL